MPRSTPPALRLAGGLFPPDLGERLTAGDLPGQEPAAFGFPTAGALEEALAAAWRTARVQWVRFRRRLDRLPPGHPATTLTRRLWVRPLLALLGYRRLTYAPRAQRVNGLPFAISHFDGDLPVHIVGCRLSLDERPPRARLSPHALLQEYLNRSGQRWGIVTNGERLRLLRADPMRTRPAYAEFDLGAIFTAGRFPDFERLYRLLHRTRLAPPADGAEVCLLEAYHRRAPAHTEQVIAALRQGAAEALRVLGRGFLRHPANQPLRDALARGDLSPEAYARHLLRLVERLIFLLAAAARGLHRDAEDDPRTRRALIRRAIPQESPLAHAELSAPDLDAALRHLTFYPHGDALRPFPYAALDGETLGEVHEALLAWRPVVRLEPAPPDFDLRPGPQRKHTGAYYTPPALVQHLVRSALDPVIRHRLRGKSTPQERERALLSIRVVDPATGAGHFLLAAARRLAWELAALRTGEACPAPPAFRAAVREVIRHSIHGVDRDPLAAELSRMALWLESGGQGSPSAFLADRIRVGDALVGVFQRADLEQGVPDGAFTPVAGDDPALARALREVNRRERAQAPEVGDAPAEGLALACDLWTAAFFQPYPPTTEAPPITTATVRAALTQPQAVDARTAALARALARRHAFFHWPLAFPEVFGRGGFDVVLGNPPYGQWFTAREKRFLRAQARYRGAPAARNAAAYFLALALHLVHPQGRVGFVMPKSLTFSHAWRPMRRLILPRVAQVVDVGRAWPEVLLEQVLITVAGRPSPQGVVACGRMEDNGRAPLRRAERGLWQRLGMMPTGATATDEALLALMLAGQRLTLSRVCRTQRGTALQRFVRPSGDLPVVLGRDIAEFRPPPPRGFVRLAEVPRERLRVARPGEVIFQNIVAHITRPGDHIRLIGTVVEEETACADTVNLLRLTVPDLEPYALAAYLMSDLVNWFVYLFVYNRAVRTMHFDGYVLDKVPLPPLERLAPLGEVGRALRRRPDDAALWRALNEVVYDAFGVPPRLRAEVAARHKPRWL